MEHREEITSALFPKQRAKQSRPPTLVLKFPVAFNQWLTANFAQLSNNTQEIAIYLYISFY